MRLWPFFPESVKRRFVPMSEQNISSTMQENRLFPPPPGFAAKAHIKSREEYERMYRESIDDPDSFWGRAAEPLHWFKRWDRVLEWKPPFARWFVGGKTNVGVQLPRSQIELGRGDKTAILWEGEPEATPGAGGDVRRLTFKDLHDAVCKFANGLKKLGVNKGDRVTIYMPMVPEAAVAMLACARIRRAALGHLRRLLQPGDRRSRRRRAERIRHHRRRRLPAWHGRAAEEQRRRGADRTTRASRRSSS
jgi:hypothetical protein